MSQPHDDEAKPMTERSEVRSGAEIGGIRKTMAGGLADAFERKSERRDDPATGTASTGDAVGGAERLDLGGTNEPGSAPGGDAPSADGSAAQRPATRDRSDRPAPPQGKPVPARDRTIAPNAHNPNEPPDEGPVESFGRAVSEVVTGTFDEEDGPGDPAKPAPPRK